MARGTLYEIEENIEHVGLAEEYTFYDLAGHEFDYARKLENPNMELETFLGAMRSFGMPTGTEKHPETGEDISYFEVTEEGRKAYFARSFERMKKLALELTLEEFSSDSSKNWDLAQSVEHTYEDAVTSQNDTFQTLDRFMRSASGRYYIGNVFYMK